MKRLTPSLFLGVLLFGGALAALATGKPARGCG